MSEFYAAIVRRHRESGNEAKAKELEVKYGLSSSPEDPFPQSFGVSDAEASVLFAEHLAKAISSQRGAPKAKAWIPTQVGYAARVYVGTGSKAAHANYFTVSRSGEHRASTGGSVHFVESSFFASQRRAIRDAIQAYDEILRQWHEDVWTAYQLEEAGMKHQADEFRLELIKQLRLGPWSQ